MSIHLTDTAVQEIKNLMEQQQLPETAGVRVGVRGGGCSGFSYQLNFDMKKADDDHVIEQDGVRVFCDPKSFGYLQNVTLNFTTGLQGRGFHFQNPDAKSTCGCGESFAV